MNWFRKQPPNRTPVPGNGPPVGELARVAIGIERDGEARDAQAPPPDLVAEYVRLLLELARPAEFGDAMDAILDRIERVLGLTPRPALDVAAIMAEPPADPEQDDQPEEPPPAAKKRSAPKCGECGHYFMSRVHRTTCPVGRAQNPRRTPPPRPLTAPAPVDPDDGPSHGGDNMGPVAPRPDYSHLTDGSVYPVHRDARIVDGEGTRFWKETEGTHLHLWKVPASVGPTALGQCSACGARREFFSRDPVTA